MKIQVIAYTSLCDMKDDKKVAANFGIVQITIWFISKSSELDCFKLLQIIPSRAVEFIEPNEADGRIK